MLKKIILCFFISIISLFLFSLAVLAEEPTDNQAGGTSVENNEQSEVTAADLEIEEPGVVSWFKNIIQDVKILVSRDPIKKSELQLKKASRQLVQARKLVQENPDDAKLQEKLEKLDTKYQGLIDKINSRIENYKQENPDAPQLKNFLDKYTDQQLKHQEILKKLEEQVPEKALEIIKNNRERHLQKFGEVMNRLQNKEELKERLKNSLENGTENIEHRVNRMEILDELEQMTVGEVKAELRELKEDNQGLFQELKEQREVIHREGYTGQSTISNEEKERLLKERRERGFIENLRERLFHE